ncbi:hypothetical protein [Novosphingobium mangrovi (ex Huang et al. 2023)]|uniref:Bacterial surface antigen (D15) domain-containing protein n=1 Tax=Novosphingobium mangrovi (ex Huang et al. 2023) TaxID=2976432 RepID=A0ABT2I4H6_9SPHN|nr:hypothetical protein [Novosphingobium mangrovi (ex Huang et al. 2023)]MCT2399711.1 hypothetical protein [Novosphingobium mangrovi (ex Huang et al. 2023)]
MRGAQTTRGQPLVALLAIFAGWIGGRATAWEAPVLTNDAVAMHAGAGGAVLSTVGFVVDGRAGPQSLPGLASPVYASAYPPASVGGFLSAYGTRYPGGFVAFQPTIAGAMPPAPVVVRPLGVWDPSGSVWGASARSLMPASGRVGFVDSALRGSNPPFFSPDPQLPRASAAPQAVPPVPLPQPARVTRWSFDTWALLRNDAGQGLSSGVLPAAYGASQTGAVLRYLVDSTSPYRPTIYARTTTALGQFRENSVALGLSGRPLPTVPVVAAIEGRLTDYEGQSRFQPAAFVYTQLPPIALPHDLQAEAYLQGGYVGGEFSTPFADGQVRVDRRVLRLGAAEARLGGGLWGGAQKGAARLDMGPSATVTLPLSRRVFGRIALDWRVRVAGNAEPGSGPAVTLSAGF